MIGNFVEPPDVGPPCDVSANHPHYQCASKAPFMANNWFEWANCEWTMEHPQKCKEGKPQRMMTCQVVCNEAEPAQPAKPSLQKLCDQAKIDLTFLVDGSGSVGSKNFDITKDFLKDVITHLDVGNNKTHVNIFQYSDRHNVELVNATKKPELLKAIKDMNYHDGSDTLTGAGITFVTNSVFMTPLSRPGATPVFIVVTDGKSYDDVKAPIDEVHAMGIETVAVGVGSGVDLAQLALIASKPKNIHAEPDFASLKKLQEQLTEEICKVVIVNGGGHNHGSTTTVRPSSTPTMSSSSSSSSSAASSSTSTMASASANPVV